VNWILETIRIALASLRANKLRTGLTILGVIIGIGTIIGMLSLINGINESVSREFERLGPNVVYITSEEPGLHVGGRRRDRKRIELDEVEALRKRCSSVGRISMISENRAKAGYRGRTSSMVTVMGVQADYDEVTSLEVEQGRFFSRVEERRSRSCILGNAVAASLFGRASAVDREVEIEGRRFHVVGVLEEAGVVLGSSYDETVLIPFERGRTIFGRSDHEYVMLLPARGVGVDDMIGHVRLSLRTIRRIRLGEEDDFAISTAESLLETYNRLTGSIYWVMRIVASIALLVSGIGIMNIMFVVVMERTREIGLRKAVGAPRMAIAGQFLVESIALTLLGGIVGIGLGYLICLLVAAATPLPASVPFWAVPVSLGICCAVGIFFGMYPALRASGLDPVKALRYE
jgi:putative ABC transport system permease protein